MSLLFAAVQNERDTISKRPRGEDPENRHGLTTNVLLSAEILSRPATSPPGSVLGYLLGNDKTLSIKTYIEIIFTVNSCFSGHPQDCHLVSIIVSVHISGCDENDLILWL